MSDEMHSPTVRRRRLGARLRVLREASEMTADQACKRLAEYDGVWSPSKMSRLESAQVRKPSPRDVRDMLEVYGVTDLAEREALIQLAKDAGKRDWWLDYEDILDPFVGFESEATTIRNAEALFVPGLLQTEDYARAIFRASLRRVADDEIDRRVTARMERQRILDRESPPHVWAIIDEGALRRPIGGAAVMVAQLDHLIDAAGRKNISLQIVRTAVGAHAGMYGTFFILDFPDPHDAPLVYVETATGGFIFDRPEQLSSYETRFEDLKADALGFNETITCLAAIRDELAATDG